MQISIYFLIIFFIIMTFFYIIRLYKITSERVYRFFPKLNFSLDEPHARKISYRFVFSYVGLIASFGLYYYLEYLKLL